MRWLALVFFLVGVDVCYAGPTLTVELPAGAQIQSATATALKLNISGRVNGNGVTFSNLLPDTPYDVKITLKDGTVLQGVDLSWYAAEAGDKKAEALDEDDRQQIKELFNGIKAFENKRNALAMAGDHDHVTILAELIRDNGFHSSAGDEVIWRVELWYFKGEHGGWEKVAQQGKVLRRERFKSKQAYQAAVAKLRWVPDLGGIRVGPNASRKITVDPAKPPPGAGFEK